MTCHCGHEFNWSEAETVVPCHALHFSDKGRFSLWGSTCKGCSPIAHAKLAAWRTGVVCAAVPVGVVAGVAVASAAAAGGVAYCSYKAGQEAGKGAVKALENCTSPASLVLEEEVACGEVAYDYVVSLDRSKGEALGIDVVRTSGWQLEVVALSGHGLAAEWNQQHGGQLKCGDRIVDVNEFRDAPSMLAACRSNRPLELKLRCSPAREQEAMMDGSQEQ